MENEDRPGHKKNYFPPKGRSVAQRNVGPRAENKFIMPEGETHFPMTPEARLKNDNLTGLLEFLSINCKKNELHW